MDRFGPTGKVSKKLAHLSRWTTFLGWTGPLGPEILVEWIAPKITYFIFFCQCVSGRYPTNPAIRLVPGARGMLPLRAVYIRSAMSRREHPSFRCNFL